MQASPLHVEATASVASLAQRRRRAREREERVSFSVQPALALSSLTIDQRVGHSLARDWTPPPDPFLISRNVFPPPVRCFFIDVVQPPDSSLIESHYLGRLEHRCTHCGALHWLAERLVASSQDNPLYGSCCLQGKVSIDFVAPLPEQLYRYFVGAEDDALEFRLHIRRYNKAFAFTSTGGHGHLDCTVFDGHGPPTYKIQGEIYHQIGPLRPEENHSPLYSQLYIHDPTDALDHRKANNPRTRADTMAFLQELLMDCNPFVTVYEQAADLTRSTHLPDYCLKLDFLRASDIRRYNLPTARHELAAIIPGDVDACINARNIIIREKGGPLMRITEVHPSYVALHFPLLAPTGQSGWHPHLRFTFSDAHPRGPRSREFMSFCEFLKHRLHIRPSDVESDHYFRSGFLLQEYIVDSWAAAEHSRLDWIRHNQETIRAELYCGLVDALREGLDLSSVGRKVILPSSFTCGPRSVQHNLQDALALLRIFKGSDLFITFTANPTWVEIREALLPGQSACDRPDIVARVFHLKLAALLDDIMKKELFGKALGYVYTVEYQKRGLPHVHLIVFLHPAVRLSTPERIDQFISTEFPDEDADPELHALVKTHMVHGPCGTGHYSPCLNDKKECSKGFPKPYQEATEISGQSYVKTKRRNTGTTVSVRNVAVDNRSVVSYSPQLLRRYQAHINVECTTGFNAIKYIYKVSHPSSPKFLIECLFHSTSTKDQIAPRLPLIPRQMLQCVPEMRCNCISMLDMSARPKHMHVLWVGRHIV
jgi:hypothetical protein